MARRPRLWRALALAAILGWALYVGSTFFLVPALRAAGTGETWPEIAQQIRGPLNALPFMAVVGVPIALAASFLFGWLFLRRADLSTLTLQRAIQTGAGVAAAIAALSIVAGRIEGWRLSRDDTAFSQIGGGAYIRSIDGILTPYGWWVLAQDTAIFILIGAVVGGVVWAVMTPGSKEG